MKLRAVLAAAGLSTAVFSVALAQAPAPPAPSFAAPNLTDAGVRAIAANCAPCHGSNGRAAPGSTVAGLAGRADVADLMKAFKEGKREATVMHQIAKGYSDAEIGALSAYLAKQPR